MNNTAIKGLTLNLLRVIGSPFVSKNDASINGESEQLLHYADKNKLKLLYLDKLNQLGRLDKLRGEYGAEKAKHQDFLAGLSRVSEVLRIHNVKHVIIKTLRPYPAVPSDVDVVVLGGQDEYKTAIVTLLEANYAPFLSHIIDGESLANEQGAISAAEILTRPTWEKAHISPGGATFVDGEHGTHIDLQNEIAVSYLTYLDKSKFDSHLSTATLPDGKIIISLAPELELVSVIAHSVMERSYRLGEFYTFLYHLSEMDEQQIEAFISLTSENRFNSALKAFTSLTMQLHEVAFGSRPPKMESVLAKIGSNSSETRKLKANDFKMPHRYCLSTMAGVFFGKMKEKKFRKGVVRQSIKMFDPKVARLVLRELTGRGDEN